MQKTYIVIPNWNGVAVLPACLDSLSRQSQKHNVVVVDNGSSDSSLKTLRTKYPEVEVVVLKNNRGFAGGVNAGINYAISKDAEFIGLINNDATADKHWLEKLSTALAANSKLGVVTGKILDADGKHIDSTGDLYTIWGLPFPRGRGEPNSDKYDSDTVVFGASGGASLYRTKMLQQIGLFDEDFFAYYEDVDLSFRAQLAGWRVNYVPGAIAYHHIGVTSGKISGFTTYQTIKNLPLLFWKNVPWSLVPTIWPRLTLAYWSFVISAISRGQAAPALKGLAMAFLLMPKKLLARRGIQKRRRASVSYINNILHHDLPPNARRLRTLRQNFNKLPGRGV